ncbi:MAG: nuclear transport factor 2 family protein, partial [Cyclobacteriaceae bacterium]|nr:nuclear transport factor 2 family protein [Cyclobacteriaceae bacterium]
MDKQIDNLLEKSHADFLDIVFGDFPFSKMEGRLSTYITGYGTNINERCLSFSDFIDILKLQRQESEGMEMRFEKIPVSKMVFSNGHAAAYIDEIKVHMNVEGNDISIVCRLSSVFEFTGEKWKVIHFHGSIPQGEQGDQDTWAVKEWMDEKEKLKKLIEEQTTDLRNKNQELKIEAATHKVRSVAMEMQSPEDIMNVLSILRKEIQAFKLGNISTWLWVVENENKITQWDISEYITNSSLANFNFTFNIEDFIQIRKHKQQWEINRDYYHLKWEGDDLQNLIKEVTVMNPESGDIFRKVVDSENIKEYWQASSEFTKGIIGLD